MIDWRYHLQLHTRRCLGLFFGSVCLMCLCVCPGWKTLAWRSSQFLFSSPESSFLLLFYWCVLRADLVRQFLHHCCSSRKQTMSLSYRCVLFTCITSMSRSCSWPTWRLWWTHTTAPSPGNRPSLRGCLTSFWWISVQTPWYWQFNVLRRLDEWFLYTLTAGPYTTVDTTQTSAANHSQTWTNYP